MSGYTFYSAGNHWALKRDLKTWWPYHAYVSSNPALKKQGIKITLSNNSHIDKKMANNEEAVGISEKYYTSQNNHSNDLLTFTLTKFT